MKTRAYAAFSPSERLKPYEFERRDVLEGDVAIHIKYSGVCHSDIHKARGDWGKFEYPMVPGHEIVGEVIAVGSAVSDFSIGDTVGVGVMVGSCGECQPCKNKEEVYCKKGRVSTYGSKDPIDGTQTQGGYADRIVVDRKFVFSIPDGLDPAQAAPLLCAGITMYSPLKHWNAGPEKKIGIVGLGGLGHMGVKIAVALGAEVYAISRTADKAKVAQSYGANGTIVTSDKTSFQGAKGSLDLIIDTVPVAHDLMPYLSLLDTDGVLVVVGAMGDLPSINGRDLIGGRKSIAGSLVGGTGETNEMLAFCAQHNIVADTTLITFDTINEAWDAVAAGDMSSRYVIDVDSSFSE